MTVDDTKAKSAPNAASKPYIPGTNNTQEKVGDASLPAAEATNANDVSMDSALSSKSGKQRKKKPKPTSNETKSDDVNLAEFQCLTIDKNTDLTCPTMQNDLRDGITAASNFLNLIQSNDIYAMAGNDTFIHALCLVTNTTFD